jgi:two-component system, LuxR family, sensor kinase FixL
VPREAHVKAALLASIVDSSDDAITSRWLDGTILSWSPGAERMFGYSAEEVVGRNLLIPEEERREEEYIVAQMAGGKPVEHLETVRQRKDGSKIDVSITASPVRDAMGNIVATCRIVRDITARKQAEQEIANNSMRLKVMLDSTLDGLITIDSKAVIQSLNASAERMFGFTPEEVIGRNLEMLTIDPFRNVHDGYSARDLKIGEVKIIEIERDVTGQRKDGTVFPMDLTVSAFRVGNESGFVAIVRDITARKLVEDSGSLLLASIVASSDDGIISKTLSGTITSWNTSAERMFGFNARQAIGQHISIIVPPEKIEEEAIILERLNRGEEVHHFETVRMGMNGQRIPVELTISPVRDGAGGLIGSSKIIRNITARMEVEAERHQTGANLRALLDHAVDGLITIDEYGNMESFNPACKRIFGYESEDVIGKNVKMLMPEPYRAAHDGYLSHYSATGEARIIGTAGREVMGKRKDGSIFPMDLSVSVFELGGGKHYSGIIRDITARKAAEAEREEIAVELARYTRALERSNLELDAFAYAASHDLKAPLRVIHNASMWIEEDLAGNLTAEIRENMTLLRSRVRRMDRLLDDLLEYSRIGRETDNSHAEAISGTVLMENILGLLAPPECYVVKASFPFAGIEVFRMPLQQILINLISNAIKHHDKKAGHIDVSVEDLGAMYHFSVKDDGPGIPAQYHEQIFRMFQTLKPRDQVEGSGMGLAMVRKHIDIAGGELKVESAVGQGSTFSFTWPKQQMNLQNRKHRFTRVEET